MIAARRWWERWEGYLRWLPVGRRDRVLLALWWSVYVWRRVRYPLWWFRLRLWWASLTGTI